MMRDECSCRSLAASGRLIQCSNSVLQFPVQNSETSHASQKLSAKREELPRGHLPPTITRHSGFEGRLGKKCRYAKRRGTLLGNGAGLIGTLGRIGGSLNLDRAGGTSSQVPGTIGLLEHVQTVLGTCRPVWGGGGERCLQGGKAQGSWAALPESPGPFGKSRLTPPRGPFRPHGPLSRTSFPHSHRLQSLGTSSNALDAFLVLPGAGRMAPAGWLGEADQTQQGTG